ncbi:hypothetical protein BKN14_04430 [Candidatus Gracilibacteria bacterium HOT-871]|nr:hypothetical protein BKN14_04430 [Candidatus Gracilibacteria bacterium HOT-871]
MLFLVCFVGIVNTSFAGEIRILNSYEIKEEIKKIELKINYTKNRLKYLNYTNPNYKTQESLYLEVELNELEYYLEGWQKDLEIRLGYEKLRRNFLICFYTTLAVIIIYIIYGLYKVI